MGDHGDVGLVIRNVRMDHAMLAGQFSHLVHGQAGADHGTEELVLQFPDAGRELAGAISAVVACLSPV